MVGGSYGVPEVAENGQKSQEQSGDHGGRRRHFVCPIPARLASVGLEILLTGSSGCPPPPDPACVAGGRPVVPPLVQTPTARKWFKNCLTRCS